MEAEVFNKLIGELRAQVNTLSSAAQMLTPLVTEQGRKTDADYLAVINKNLYQLIRTIYHLELCGEEDHAFSPKGIDVAGLCRDICREVDTMADRLGVNFDWRLDKEGVLSLADGELLCRAILNLLTNAFAAAGKGGRVSLRCGVTGKRFTVTVTDSGKGLKLPQGDENPLLKTEGGLGLGLAAARKVAALHGGSVMLKTAEDAGVSAVLSLPIRPPEKWELVREKGPVIDHSGGYSVLLVEFSPLLDADSFLSEDIE